MKFKVVKVMAEEQLSTSVSEERINLFENKIKDKRNHENNSFIFRITFFLIVIFSLCLCPFLSVFSCYNTEVKGSFLLDTETLLSYASYKKSTPLLFIDEQKLEESILTKEYIADCEVSWHLFGLDITIDEIACVLHQKDGEQTIYYLTNGKTLTDFKSQHPTSTYDFHENDTPCLISDFSFDNNLADASLSTSRRLKLLKNLKEIAPEVLKSADYFDIVYDQSLSTLLFGFYFLLDDGHYARILLRDESFAFFLKESNKKTILNSIEHLSEKKLFNHDIIEISYYNTVCIYDGKDNSCRITTI